MKIRKDVHYEHEGACDSCLCERHVFIHYVGRGVEEGPQVDPLSEVVVGEVNVIDGQALAGHWLGEIREGVAERERER